MAAALTPEQQAYKAQLAAQVKSGAIKQSQMDAEMTRYLGTPAAGATPAATSATNANQALASDFANLDQQVASGGINAAQAEAEKNRLRGIYGQSHPQATGLNFDTPQDLINSTLQTADVANQRATGATNPNQFGPFGNQTSKFNPATGQWEVTQDLSQGNKDIVTGLQGSGTAANDAVANLIKSQYGSFTGEGGGGLPQTNYEQAVFSQLTRGLDEQRAKEKEQLDQSLVNRGIPIGSAAYSTAMKDFNTQYDDQFSKARSDAVTAAAGMQNQAISTLQGVGQGGFMNPNFKPFEAQPYNAPDPNAVFQSFLEKQKVEEAKRQFDAAHGGGGGGGGGGGRGGGGGGGRTYTVASPFSTRPPGG